MIIRSHEEVRPEYARIPVLSHLNNRGHHLGHEAGVNADRQLGGRQRDGAGTHDVRVHSRLSGQHSVASGKFRCCAANPLYTSHSCPGHLQRFSASLDRSRWLCSFSNKAVQRYRTPKHQTIVVGSAVTSISETHFTAAFLGETLAGETVSSFRDGKRSVLHSYTVLNDVSPLEADDDFDKAQQTKDAYSGLPRFDTHTEVQVHCMRGSGS